MAPPLRRNWARNATARFRLSRPRAAGLRGSRAKMPHPARHGFLAVDLRVWFERADKAGIPVMGPPWF
jgi:hypothetical protein